MYNIKILQGDNRKRKTSVYNLHSLKPPWSEPEIKEWTIWQKDFLMQALMKILYWKISNEVVNGENVHMKWF